MAILTHEEFFAKLAELFSNRRSRGHGRVYLTQKRYSHGRDVPKPTEDDPFADLHPEKPIPILVRATNGKGKEQRKKKFRLSTLVEPGELDVFYGRYAEACKVGMSALKPRDKTKKKTKARRKKATL